MRRRVARGAGASAGREQVERAVLGQEVAWVELLAGLGADGVQHGRVGQAGEGLGDGHPDGVASPRVGADHALERVRPAGGGVWVAGEDADGVGCC